MSLLAAPRMASDVAGGDYGVERDHPYAEPRIVAFFRSGRMVGDLVYGATLRLRILCERDWLLCLTLALICCSSTFHCMFDESYEGSSADYTIEWLRHFSWS